MEKQRLDQLLVSRGLVQSRQIAQSLILRGDVLVDDVPVTKAGVRIPEGAAVRIRGELPKYVGRGGDRLESALLHFGVDLVGVVALDLGASTGGFTHCMLQRGASLVFAVDVGTNQIDDLLRRDPRVRSLEGLHAKDLVPEMFDPRPGFLTIDVSFISVRKVIPPAVGCLSTPWRGLFLVKPQFELERGDVEKGGVIRSAEKQLEAVSLVEDFLRGEGIEYRGSFACPILGAKAGNQEYFIYAGSVL